MKAYEYLFYRIYRIKLKPPYSGEISSAYLSASLLFGPLLLNIIFISFLISNVFSIEIVRYLKYIAPVFILLNIVFNYFYFLRHDRYKAVVERYKNETKKHRRVGTWLMWTYLWGSGIIIFFSGIIGNLIWHFIHLF